MEGVWPQLVLVAALVVVNGVLAGSEVALISLRESQLARLAESSVSGRAVARLVEQPNRFLATIQIGITLAGFLASAAAAVTLSEPLVPYLSWFGTAADTVAIVLVTLVLSFFTLVLGELVPKRMALQRSEGWALVVGRPLEWLATAARPAVWLLSVTTNAVVRLLGGEPGASREEIDLRELRDMVIANQRISPDHQEVVVGALEVADRTLRQILIPRPDVMTLSADELVSEALSRLVDEGHTRAPIVAEGGLDATVGVVHLRDLVRARPDQLVGELGSDVMTLPESLPVLTAMNQMQERREQMALVIDEFGGADGIVTMEDLVEELVGEIYDEFDPQVRAVVRSEDGSLLVSGRFPVHDLIDIGVTVPPGEYTTVAGLVLDELGGIPERIGVSCEVGDWKLTVVSVRGRVPDRVRFERLDPGSG